MQITDVTTTILSYPDAAPIQDATIPPPASRLRADVLSSSCIYTPTRASRGSDWASPARESAMS